VLLDPVEGRREEQDFLVVRRWRWRRGRQIQDQSRTWIFLLKKGRIETRVHSDKLRELRQVH
jgi:hypothetical protein